MSKACPVFFALLFFINYSFGQTPIDTIERRKISGGKALYYQNKSLDKKTYLTLLSTHPEALNEYNLALKSYKTAWLVWLAGATIAITYKATTNYRTEQALLGVGVAVFSLKYTLKSVKYGKNTVRIYNRDIIQSRK